MTEFKGWPKTERLKDLQVTITEKIDGTNSCIIIEDGKVVGCQSRNRMIAPGDDNFGFAFWAYDNANLLSSLGDGYHYGEWAGPGIQKNPHMLEKKQFFLFNTFRPKETLPSIVQQVPILYQGPYDTDELKTIKADLEYNGSKVGPGKAEGFIIYFHNFRQSLKWTFEFPEGKWVGNIRTDQS